MLEQICNQSLEDRISLKDVIDFLVDFWKVILGASLFGLLGAIAFLAVTPNLYEATAQIQMAQISVANNNSVNNNTSPLGVNVEEPNLLMERMRLPTSYSMVEIKACGLDRDKMPAESLVALSNLSAVKGVGSVVALKIRMTSKDAAIICANTIFDNIRESQDQIIRPYIEEAKFLLHKYQVRLRNSQELVAKADKSGAALSAAYLASRDEIKFLTDESIRLNAFVTAGDARRTRLISPIYASDLPVFPKKKMTLIIGVSAGFFLGLLLVMILKLRSNYQLS